MKQRGFDILLGAAGCTFAAGKALVQASEEDFSKLFSKGVCEHSYKFFIWAKNFNQAFASGEHAS